MLHGVVKPSDMDVVLEQLHMRLDEVMESLSSLSFYSGEPESAKEREVKMAIELEKAQKKAVDHPEDFPQW
jgi:hypothetical protein